MEIHEQYVPNLYMVTTQDTVDSSYDFGILIFPSCFQSPFEKLPATAFRY